ncbi:hydantoinase/oxoprolinase family protein [Clostridioides difficile]|uniref:hydantoinase/oxoprolinase family protein n=1 Tax=Clostridioides difficile TaxID=1496 RepID=UPI00355B1026
MSQVGKAVSLGFEKALKDLGIDAQIYFSQNDGTLMNLEYTMKYPIFTIGCGITNSIRGASFLSKVKNAIVLDVGGTTTTWVYYIMDSLENHLFQLQLEEYIQTLECQMF